VLRIVVLFECSRAWKQGFALAIVYLAGIEHSGAFFPVLLEPIPTLEEFAATADICRERNRSCLDVLTRLLSVAPTALAVLEDGVAARLGICGTREPSIAVCLEMGRKSTGRYRCAAM
jgi:hypothetical protein